MKKILFTTTCMLVAGLSMQAMDRLRDNDQYQILQAKKIMGEDFADAMLQEKLVLKQLMVETKTTDNNFLTKEGGRTEEEWNARDAFYVKQAMIQEIEMTIDKKLTEYSLEKRSTTQSTELAQFKKEQIKLLFTAQKATRNPIDKKAEAALFKALQDNDRIINSIEGIRDKQLLCNKQIEAKRRN